MARCFMSAIKAKLKLADLDKAIANLEDALLISDPELRFEILSNRFRICFQLVWKLTKYILKYLGVEVRDNPREVLAEAMTQSILKSDSDWHEMLTARNSIVHEYSAPDFQTIGHNIASKYLNLLKDAHQRLTKEVEKLDI